MVNERKRPVPQVASVLWRRAPSFVRNAALAVNRNRPGNRVQWGNLRRTRPFSAHYGYDRGIPVDRHYVEIFLDEHRQLIHGTVLEVKDSTYTRRFGAPDVRPIVVDIAADNPHVDIVADLCVPGSLGEIQADCVILTQTLQFLVEPIAAFENLWSALRPGGALLVTAPSISPVDAWLDNDYWRVTPSGLRHLLTKACPDATSLSVRSYGNALAAVAAVHGLSLQEVSVAEIDDLDPAMPLVAAAVVQK
jgi:hypothetical protein